MLYDSGTYVINHLDEYEMSSIKERFVGRPRMFLNLLKVELYLGIHRTENIGNVLSTCIPRNRFLHYHNQ